MEMDLRSIPNARKDFWGNGSSAMIFFQVEEPKVEIEEYTPTIIDTEDVGGRRLQVEEELI